MKSPRFAVVVSRFNQGITQRLLKGALSAFAKEGIPERAVRTVWVPGAFELPLAAKALAETRRYGAVVCLGCVLEGQTPHNRYISAAAAQGITQASLLTGVPIAFGVLTPRTLEQAMDRSGNDSANKGSEAAHAAVEMAGVLSSVTGKPPAARRAARRAR
ncbi:MAG: 6,7-dimethyl-8-ribityllumazine synthase [Elusimicrobia bacterium RIFCSPHIGHO2_01_FULL_64_10]|nr:MAG: 6,7-dimethyl-8-ribityllumazine synthase [Elusimicrobia bacterium RIFCSPHIGHO2_01_FULL_64_10]